MFKELTVDEWFEEIQMALDYRRQYGLEDHWGMLESVFYNVHDSQIHQGPNIIMSNGDALMSSLNVPYPYIMCKARRSDFAVGSRIQESVDNILIEEMGMVREIERGLLSAYLWGVGIFKIGYDSEWGFDRDFDAGLLHGQPAGMTLTQFSSSKKRRIEYNERVRSGMPWFECVLPHDFLVPWGVFDIQRSPWVIHRKLRHIDDVKEDYKYNARGLQPVMSAKDFVDSYKNTIRPYRIGREMSTIKTSESMEAEYVELWEIHDRRTGKIMVIATGHDRFLRNEIDVLQLEGGLPFVSISFTPRARNFWTTPDAYYLKASQAELSDIALQRAKERRAKVLKFLYGEDCFSPDELSKLLSSDVGIAAKYKNTGQDPRNSFFPLQHNHNPEPAIEEESVRRSARELIGFSRNQVGEFEAAGRRTATEAQIVAQGSELRLDRRQGALACVYQEAFIKINSIIRRFWTTPKVYEVIGPDGAPAWQTISGTDLAGEYGLKVGFSVGGQESLNQRRQNGLMAYAQLRQDPLVNPFALAQFLNRSYNDPEFSSIFADGVLNGQAEKQTQQMQQLQGIMAQAQQLQGGLGSQGQNGGGGNGNAPNIFGSIPGIGSGARGA